MKNARLKWLLQEQGHTQETLARAIGMGRARLNQLLANTPERGGVRRPQVALWMMEHFPAEKSREILAELGWDERGNLIGTFHGERSKRLNQTPTNEGDHASISQ